ncbi:Basic-leucine zipper transcription factor [Trema orientale]|uniref:Basic-leucine zipper transcription factor n=1 Tax=Trema orientale TaxID=63057 RepID=A0A2P5BRI7_TREOI|nr:Basic-leucine zipper transcription factor [Trema orientale]
MADPVVADPPKLPAPNPGYGDFSVEMESLPIPPLDHQFFSSDEAPSGDFFSDLGLGFGENCDYELTFDGIEDLHLPSDTEDFLIPYGFDEAPGSVYRATDRDVKPRSEGSAGLKSSSPESGGSTVSGLKDYDVDDFLNCQSSESGSYNGEYSRNSGGGKSNVDGVMDVPSPESDNCDQESSPVSSQGSGNCGSGVSEGANSPAHSGNSDRDVSSNVFGDQKVKLEEAGKNCMSKRKKEGEEGNGEPRTLKYRRSSTPPENSHSQSTLNPISEEDEKRKARLMRNRESAQLSRQRKKHYVEELEDKVRNMHSTITDLNSKISYIMAENATLRQQLGGGMCPPPPPPGMYPHPPMAPMGYPWMPCPPYVVKPQGSQVPLVPIPRLKPQPTGSAHKVKKSEGKKTEGKTKKVASISLLGLLFFFLLFGGLVPIVNVNFGGLRDKVPVGSAYISGSFYDQHRGRVLSVNSHLNGSGENIGVGISGVKSDGFRERMEYVQQERGSQSKPGYGEFVRLGNDSEPLVASLYVPRNDKLVKIDGNLIIHSVLASEKTKASLTHPEIKSSRETGLAIVRDLARAYSVTEGNRGRHASLYGNPSERHKALASGAAESRKDHFKTTPADGRLQQWFREGLAGPLLSSGMCTEVFQFDVSPASASGAIVPASSVSNVSAKQPQNARQNTTRHKGSNRRILHRLPIPLAGSNYNITEEHVTKSPRKEEFQGNRSVSSMVVSVLVDPREAGDVDVDGMMKPKSLSRIFVVVLIDSVKYVTYSCMLPRAGPHLVTAWG